MGSLAAAAMAPNVPAAVTVPMAPSTADPTVLQDPVFGLIEAHRKASVAHLASLGEQERLERAGIWICEAADQACDEEFRIFDVLLTAPAATLPGILARLVYLQGIVEHQAWMFEGRSGSVGRLIEGFAASIANVLAVQS